MDNTIPLIPSTADLNTKLMDIVGQYSSIETSYLRVIASMYNENVELKETNAELKRRIYQLEEEKVCESSLKRSRVEEIETTDHDTEDLRQKNVMLGKEIHTKNTKLQNQANSWKSSKKLLQNWKKTSSGFLFIFAIFVFYCKYLKNLDIDTQMHQELLTVLENRTQADLVWE